MSTKLKLWFPRGFLECHREQWHSMRTCIALTRHNIECVLDEDPEAADECDVLFCGSFALYGVFQTARMRKANRKKPTVHYNWDIYPFQVNDPELDRHGKPTGRLTANGTRWREYLEELRHVTEIWVPSQCTVTRTQEFAGRDAVVIKSPIYLWEIPPERPPTLTHLQPRTYVVDVMRVYPGDPNAYACEQACREAGFPFVGMRHRFTDEEFRWTVGNALLLVSANYEASTGGLTMLEGYAHGVDVIVSDSPRHGGVDYFGKRATYFRWDRPEALVSAIRMCGMAAGRSPLPPEKIQERAVWVATEYSDDQFAKVAAPRLWSLVG